MSYTLHLGDCIEVMKTLPANSVQCCVTSPPYFGLRDYGTATWEGGDAECDHVWRDMHVAGMDGSTQNSQREGRRPPPNILFRDLCGKCGARRIDNQIGLEETPEAYIAKLVLVFREVRRLLRDDGVLWLNLGDSYNGSGTMGSMDSKQGTNTGSHAKPVTRVPGLKPKDLIGVPWMAAFALRADGWWLRSEIIWHKKAPMPESVTDRPTKAHEQVFLLTKAANYFYDAEAIREPNSPTSQMGGAFVGSKKSEQTGNGHSGLKVEDNTWAGRNKRSVWTFGPESFAGAHFATMPTKLVEPCILAGTSAHGCCSECGAPWERVTEKPDMSQRPTRGIDAKYPTNGNHYSDDGGGTRKSAGQAYQEWRNANPDVTTGWQPTCSHNAAVVPCTVLDCFSGSATVGAVALKHGRNYIGIDLNPDYIELSHKRIGQSQPLLPITI